MRICVLSDVHCKYAAETASDRLNEELTLSFLKESIGKYDLMVLNGDIFDLWFDWKYTIIKQYFPILRRLAEIGENCCRLILTSGNHDFWFNGFLKTYIGIEIHPEQFSLQADGHKLLFTHGDLHTVNDLRYKIFRRIIRLPLVKGLFSILHPDLALSLGRRMSRSSRLRKVSHLLQTKKSAGLVRYAQSQIQHAKYDIVCMGHSHKPQVRELSGGIYVNSGDWVVHHSYVEIIDGNIDLKTYSKGV